MQDHFIGNVITVLLNMLILALLYGQFASYIKITPFTRDISSIYEQKERKKRKLLKTFNRKS